MVEYLCGGRVLGDMDRSKSFEVRGGRRIDQHFWKHEGLEARRFGRMTFLQHEVFRETSRRIGKYLPPRSEFRLEFIKNIQLIITGAEKYSGLIAGQKFTRGTEIRPIDREARGGSLHGFRTWCQPSNKLSVSRSSRCRRSWKQYMQHDILTSGRSGGVLHVSWKCSQPCGARGAAAHASGAMRSDTRAATNLNLIG
ncbi:hypothetical protein F2Q68_00043141 [Brassica cretica]|uniref:Uncharacterized protein n=1 Tax=Brassica cretica TaxID=69181 RepID=A0A8S9LJ71_BRACR|nr:hypothetical protein F2Q68_00043141 [Brassica cretica]